MTKHGETAKHKKSCQATVGQKSISDLFPKNKSNEDLETKIKEGEIRIAAFVAEHNLPLRTMDHLPTLFGAVCSDSAIAKRIKCGGTRLTSILKNVISATSRETTTELMKNNKFSIIADESTDRSCTKNICLVARINLANNDHFFLAVTPVEEATGAALFNHIIHFLKKFEIPYKSTFIGFASDGANNPIIYEQLSSQSKIYLS